MLVSLCKWLESTALSQMIQNIDWIIPLVQVIHILCLAIVLSSVALMDLRLMGLGGRRVSIAGMAQRFLPWIWCAVVVMAITGAILIIGEPPRSLRNIAFQIKMVLLLGALMVTFFFQRTVRSNAQYWDQSPAHQTSARLTAVVSMSLWFGIAVCGRLIAYMTPDP